MSLMDNVIGVVRSTGFCYWAAYVGGEKIKTDGPKRHTGSDDITQLWHTLIYSALNNKYLEIWIYCYS